MAKTPVPGRVKTRLCPPLEPEGAAEVAAAAIADTLAAVAACGADRRVVALDGAPGPWLPEGVEVIPQRGDGLAERLANAWSDAAGAGPQSGPVLQIGMDTPQVTPQLLDDALGRLADAAGSEVAVLGAAEDGGWWALGCTRSAPEVFDGVPMSTAGTGAAQRARLIQLGWRIEDLPVLRDIDRADDLSAVAALAPTTATAVVAARLLAGGVR